MKVTIDTKEDSHEDIRKVLGILTHILENKPNTNDSSNLVNIPNSSNAINNSNVSNPSNVNNPSNVSNSYGVYSSEPKKEIADTTNMMSMFGSSNGTSSSDSSPSNSSPSHSTKDSYIQEPVRDTAPDFTSLMNLTRREEEKKEEPKIEWL